MTRFYTRTGDDGTTGILGKDRVKKYDLRMEALGTLDELSAALGIVRSMLPHASDFENVIISLQRKVYELMTEVAASRENAEKYHSIESASIVELEKKIDEFASSIDSPQGFILPGGTPASAVTSLARTIARRAERRTAELLDRGDIVNPELVVYLNRLSSLLFVMEIKLSGESGNGKPRLAKDVPQ